MDYLRIIKLIVLTFAKCATSLLCLQKKNSCVELHLSLCLRLVLLMAFISMVMLQKYCIPLVYSLFVQYFFLQFLHHFVASV